MAPFFRLRAFGSQTIQKCCHEKNNEEVVEMEFYDMVQRLQLMYGMRIILICCGSFYISIGADAIVLNKELGLKLNCAKKCVCKVGVPKNSIDKCTKLLRSSNGTNVEERNNIEYIENL